jgi:hypothetical protein
MIIVMISSWYRCNDTTPVYHRPCHMMYHPSMMLINITLSVHITWNYIRTAVAAVAGGGAPDAPPVAITAAPLLEAT